MRAKAKPKAAAKGAARAGAVVRGGRRLGLRRPASRRAGDKDEEKDKNLGLSELLESDLVILEGLYWEAACKVAGKGLELTSADGGKFLKFEVTGTDSEALLAYLSGQTPRLLQVHLCQDPCENKLWKDGLFHLQKSSAWTSPPEDWMRNLREVVPPPGGEGGGDELAALRAEAEELRKKVEKKKKEKKSKSPKRKKREEKDEEEKKKKKVKKARIKAKKSLAAVLGQTGLDPDPEVRRYFAKEAKRMIQGKKKKKKKKEKKSKSGSEGSSLSGSKKEDSSSSETGDVGALDQDDLFEATSSAKKISQAFPGVLASAWMKEVQSFLLTSQGQIWDMAETQVQPLAMQYFRHQVQQKLSGPMSREYQTIAMMVDLAVQGKVAELSDLGVQRLKSLLATASGIHYTVAQKLEVLPTDRIPAASMTETNEAAKAAKEEERVFNRAARKPLWQSNPSESSKGGKGKDGKNKKGKGKDGKGKGGDKTQASDAKQG